MRRFRSEGGTVLLTTHYMEEAEQLCDRVAVIDHGKRIALGRPADLVAALGGDHIVEVTVEGIENRGGETLVAGLPGVRNHRLDDGVLSLTVEAPHVTIPALLRSLADRSLELDGLHTRHTSLEDVFMDLTGRHLRDDA